jgi:hypothetical protein
MSFTDVAKHGQYYNPAHKHYQHHARVNVVCDRCKKKNLDACIGYQDLDLCLSCAERVNEIIKKNESTPTHDIHPYIRTRMVTDRFTPSQKVIMTKMNTSRFDISPPSMVQTGFPLTGRFDSDDELSEMMTDRFDLFD